jgi:hypothetical protein
MDVQIYLFKIIFLNHNLESKAGTNSHPCKHMDVQNDTRWHFRSRNPCRGPFGYDRDLISAQPLAIYSWTEISYQPIQLLNLTLVEHLASLFENAVILKKFKFFYLL